MELFEKDDEEYGSQLPSTVFPGRVELGLCGEMMALARLGELAVPPFKREKEVNWRCLAPTTRV